MLYLDGGGVKFFGSYEDLEAHQSDFLKIAFGRRASAENADSSRDEEDDDFYSDQPIMKQVENFEKANTKSAPSQPQGNVVTPSSNLITEEEKAHNVNCMTLCSYVKYSCGCIGWIFIFLISCMPAFSQFYISEWLREWL